MNAVPSGAIDPKRRDSVVIKPWLSAGLTIALAANVVLSAVLLLTLSRFDDSKRQADEAEIRAAGQRTELATLKVEVESLTKQKDVLAPTLADWQQRLKEKAAADALLATLDGKQRQMESDIAQSGKRLEDARRALLEAEKQKTDVNSTVDRLKAESDALAKSNTDGRALVRQAEEAERRLNSATNALANVDARRKQLETDASAAQTRFDQVQKESDDLRQARETLTKELITLRQQVQAQKDHLATFDQKSAELKTIQSAVQQEEQKLAKLQQQSATAEARATEIESRQRQAASEFSQLTNRLEQVRRDATDWETKHLTAKSESEKAMLDLAAAQKLLAETQASQDQLVREHAKLVAQVPALKKELELARKDAADAETRRDAAKAELPTANADLAAARTQLQVFVIKKGELTREISRLEATVELLKQEKEPLEREIGRLEAQRQKTPPDGEKQ
jgi:chromosome segregation ATPase